jgi:hypothetical protein
MNPTVKKTGSVGIGALLTIVGGSLTMMAWVIMYVQGQVQPVAAQSQASQTAISEINTKLDFILGKYGAEYSQTYGKIIIASSSENNNSSHGQ